MGTLRIVYEREHQGVRAVVRRVQHDGLAPVFRVEITVRNRSQHTFSFPIEDAAKSLVDSHMDSLPHENDSGD